MFKLLISTLFYRYQISSFAIVILVSVFPLSAQSQTIHLTTEHYPPYNIDLSLNNRPESQQIGGASTDIVKELMKRSKYSHTLELLPWKRAYRSAQDVSYTGVFSTTRTPAREELFKWVGPIADNNYVLFSAKNRDIPISSIEDVKSYTVGAYSGSVAVSIMSDLGISTELVPSDHLNVLKLQRQRIDLWIAGSLSGPYLAKQNGFPNLKAAYTVRKAKMYIAFNKDTPNSVIDHLNAVLQTMREDGFVDRVYARYR